MKIIPETSRAPNLLFYFKGKFNQVYYFVTTAVNNFCMPGLFLICPMGGNDENLNKNVETDSEL
jgi:hypothetical protein